MRSSAIPCHFEFVMSLFELPSDLIKIILQSISLRDIARLLLATNNCSSYRVLLGGVHDLQYPRVEDYPSSDAAYDWAREKRIRLSYISVPMFVTSMTAQLRRYLLELGSHVTHLELFDEDFPLDSIAELVPNVVHFFQYQTQPVSRLLLYFPRLESIQSDETLDFNCLTRSRGSQLKEIIAGVEGQMLRKLHLFPNLTKLKFYHTFDGLSVDDASALSNECPQLTSVKTTLRGDINGLRQLLIALPAIKELQFSAWLNHPLKSCLPTYAPGLMTLNIEIHDYSAEFFTFIANSCPNLSVVRVCVFEGSYLVRCRASLASLLANCKFLKSLEYSDKTIRETADMLYDVLSHGHATLTQLAISQHHSKHWNDQRDYNVSVNSSLPSLRTLHLYGSMSSKSTQLLKGCPILSTLVLHDPWMFNKHFDPQTLYEACPNVSTIQYEGSGGRNLLDYSNDMIENIVIRHDFKSCGWFGSGSGRASSFHSLKRLEIHGGLDDDTWNHLLSCQFNIQQLIVGMDIYQSPDPVLHGILCHGNFKHLELVLCSNSVDELKMMTAMSKDRIQFHFHSWLDLSPAINVGYESILY